ncbi:MAG: hypothetical protein OXU72_12625 [Gammaproteobacteria bacterium]|nr:hypothetical protein [Gammaproteobacteria bacterium]
MVLTAELYIGQQPIDVCSRMIAGKCPVKRAKPALNHCGAACRRPAPVGRSQSCLVFKITGTVFQEPLNLFRHIAVCGDTGCLEAFMQALRKLENQPLDRFPIRTVFVGRLS